MIDKFNFNLKKTAIYQAVKWAKDPFFRFTKFVRIFFLTLFIITFLLFLYGFLLKNFSSELSSKLLGLLIIFFILDFICQVEILFLNLKLKQPFLNFAPQNLKGPALLKEAALNQEKYNLADFLSFEVARIVSISLNLAKKKKISEVNSTLLFYSFLENSGSGILDFVFSRALFNYKEVRSFLKKYLETIIPKNESRLFSQDFQGVILESFKAAEKKNRSRIGEGDLFVGLAKHDLIFKKILIDNDLKSEDIENLVRWWEVLLEKQEEKKKFWLRKNLLKKGSLAKEWAAGYTLNLDKFSVDLSEIVKNRGFPEVIGHKKEIESMERILSRSENSNVLIIGEPGSGRKSMVYEIANKSVLGESLPEVNYKRVVQLDLAGLLAQTTSMEEVEVVLDNVFKEALTAGNVILVIDEFHSFVGGETRPGAIDISGVLASYLSYSGFQIIAITTFEGLHKNIEQNPSLLSLFEKVEVSEISDRETLILLENFGLVLEQKYKKFISYLAFREIINYCSKYLPALTFPEKAMDVLDEAMVHLAQTKDKVLLPKHIARLISEKTEIPVGEVEEKERDILLNLEELMHQKIINQEEAVKEVSTALRRARAEVTVRLRPIGTFLFLGPTGVGKTETSKALAEIYFGSKQKMIRLDMSEFQNLSDIARLIGSSGEEGLLTTQVRENPFSLILLDEIEKAHPNILNLFLQVLDEGHLTDGVGRKVDFKNSIIIATSNAGYQIILKALKEQSEWSGVKEKLLERLFEEGLFRPEFINRFDAVVIFKPLSKENLLDIAGLMLGELKENLKNKEIDFLVTKDLKEKIVELSYDPTFGARQMRRVIQDKVENVLAQAILKGDLIKGTKAEVLPEDFSLKIN